MWNIVICTCVYYVAHVLYVSGCTCLVKQEGVLMLLMFDIDPDVFLNDRVLTWRRKILWYTCLFACGAGRWDLITSGHSRRMWRAVLMQVWTDCVSFHPLEDDYHRTANVCAELCFQGLSAETREHWIVFRDGSAEENQSFHISVPAINFKRHYRRHLIVNIQVVVQHCRVSSLLIWTEKQQIKYRHKLVIIKWQKKGGKSFK